MSDTTAPKVGTSAAPQEVAARHEFKWDATTRRGTISIVRTGQSSPVFIQANN
jgi:hypothetical protein